ncbi:MAG: nucleotidyltransferase domain-containing protein, partial [Myxococcaceae bacterium]|nr:nucleotidyltransferase domain-containing protein [Myxococcaceae bacterium]
MPPRAPTLDLLVARRSGPAGGPSTARSNRRGARDALGAPRVLTPHQLTVATRFLDEQAKAREHLVVSLSGAHAYGFPSPDSDLDLKA